MREYLLIAFYLFVVFSLFAIYKSVILAEDHIDFAPQGLALINALALAKVVLVGQELHMADQFQDAPLIYPTLLKSSVYTLVLTCFKIAEGIAVRMFHGRSFQDSIAVFWRILEGTLVSNGFAVCRACSLLRIHRAAAGVRWRQAGRRIFSSPAFAESASSRSLTVENRRGCEIRERGGKKTSTVVGPVH
jgi:hypothetical protein